MRRCNSSSTDDINNNKLDDNNGQDGSMQDADWRRGCDEVEGVGGGDADGVVSWGWFFRGRNFMRKGPSMIRGCATTSR